MRRESRSPALKGQAVNVLPEPIDRGMEQDLADATLAHNRMVLW